MNEQLREEKRKIEELHEVASEMEACHTEDEVYRLGVDAAEGILEFDICGIDVAEDGYLVPKATSTEMPNDGYDALEVDEGLAGRTFQNRESFVIPDVRTMDEAEPVQKQYRSILSVPLGDHGVFQAGSREAEAFDEDDLELAELLMSHVTEVISRIESQSALRESEEKYRTLVEGSHDAIFIHSDGRFRFVNDRVAELTGYSREELDELPIWGVVHEDDRERVKELMEQREPEEDTPHYELRVRTKDGDVRYVEMSVQVITYDGDVAHLGSARDVTERRKRKRRVERQNERLKEFASVVSHDLRNPLNVAQGHLGLAEETGEQRHFEKAESALDRMESLIGDLLKLARQGQDVSETERVDLEAVVRRAWATVSTGDASLRVADGLGELEADDGRLQELLENLFRNSVEHAGGDVVVEVGPLGGPASDDAGRVARADGFYVADDGPGIPEADREKVFEHGHTTAEDGSGLGLSIVKSIADAHGWDVSAHESDAGGARFEIATA
ncbi:PAS domain S-box protein (plasmid) [Halorussus salilacus]|uniref:PAS domain S-box protein n=1 Tax=Halorussus salilacus TaxID=2953750 RepID=UPI00209E8139|nr:PAS domain S-box protein [Halorussus salilacus]USZ69727.1 PAS domain S-box protein [Halorussus salilacus]